MFVKGVESGREERKTDCYHFMKEARRTLRGTFQTLEYAEVTGRTEDFLHNFFP